MRVLSSTRLHLVEPLTLQPEDLYREQCATRPEFYFHSPNNATLRTVFRTIGMQLSNLRIAQ